MALESRTRRQLGLSRNTVSRVLLSPRISESDEAEINVMVHEQALGVPVSKRRVCGLFKITAYVAVEVSSSDEEIFYWLKKLNLDALFGPSPPPSATRPDSSHAPRRSYAWFSPEGPQRSVALPGANRHLDRPDSTGVASYSRSPAVRTGDLWAVASTKQEAM